MFLNNDTLIRNFDIEFAEMDDEIGMLDINTGKYYLLNTIAGDIWNILEHQTTYSELIDKLVSVYSVDRVKCISETNVFLSEMIHKGLICNKG